MIDGFELSEHARFQMQERNIQPSWLTQTLSAPDRLGAKADLHGNTHYLKQISDFGDRWLRVVINPTVDPQRIVTLFFDRRVK